MSEKETSLESLTEQLNEYKRSSQGALYEKEQQIDMARVELEKVSSCLKQPCRTVPYHESWENHSRHRHVLLISN